MSDYMFKIKTDHLGSFLRFALANTKTGEYVSIIPGFGGNVNRIILRKKNKNYSILDGVRTDSELIRNLWFKGAKLIPFPNRISKGQYSFAEKSYQLPINSGRDAIHGFIYDKSLRVTNVTSNAFQYKTKITNLSNCSIPVGDGWHPYFKTEGKVDRLHIKIPAGSRIAVDAQMIPTGELIHENYSGLFQIGNKEFDLGFVLQEAGGKVITELYDTKLDLKILLWQETGKWMTCAADAFNNRMGLIILEPQQSFTANCGVRLD